MNKADKRKVQMIRGITPNRVQNVDYEDKGEEVDDSSIQDAKRRFILSKELVQNSIVSTSSVNNDTAKIKVLDKMICSASFHVLTEEQQGQLKDKYFQSCMGL
jgi:hypothetical protein